MLVVPGNGMPVLGGARTCRVKPWIERSSRVAEVIHAPRVGIEAARLIAGRKADAAVGPVHFDHLSLGISSALGGPGPRLRASGPTRLLGVGRGPPVPPERMLTRRAPSMPAG